MRSEGGFAVAAVLMLLFGAGMLLALANLGARGDTAEAAARQRITRLDAALDAASILAIADVLDNEAEDPALLDGSVSHAYTVDGVSVRARAVSQDGLLNVNSAAQEDIQRVLTYCGASEREAETAAEIIMARRERAPFQDVIELVPLLGPGEAFETALSFFTSYGDGSLNQTHAPAGVLRALERERPSRPATAPETPGERPVMVYLYLEGSASGHPARMTGRVMTASARGWRVAGDLPWTNQRSQVLFGPAP